MRQKTIDAIMAHAAAEYPRECCGVVAQKSRVERYFPCRNLAAAPEDNFVLCPEDYAAAEDWGTVIAIVHSHPDATTQPSELDKAQCDATLLSWSDPDNAYSDAMEPVFEQALVSRYGFNQLEITAIGCTRQSEANRKGRWGILTNNKDRVVTFNVGEDGNIPQPCYVIAVADRNLSGRDLGGRISAVNGRVLTLDRAPDASPADRMIVNLPSGVSQSRTIQSITGNKVTVTTAYSETPVAEAVWVIESDELYAQQYRVITVTDNNDGTFTIVGANHDPDKFDRIDIPLTGHG